jgi:hypothetical protein
MLSLSTAVKIRMRIEGAREIHYNKGKTEGQRTVVND